MFEERTASRPDYTEDEMMIVCFAREIADGDVLVQGVGAMMSAAGYLLAKKTHAPGAVLNFGVGNTVVSEAFPLSLLYLERDVLRRSFFQYGMGEAMTELTSCWSPLILEFLRPAQVDMYGNFNNTVIGTYGHPKVRLPGGAGIPDITGTRKKGLYLYTPRHNRRTFVNKLDFVTGVGFLRGGSQDERLRLGLSGLGPVRMITNLGIFGFDEESRRMMVQSIHPGVTVRDIQQNTEFEMIIPPKTPETVPPSDDELRLIREEIDPMGLRKLEILPAGKDRDALIKGIMDKEMQVRTGGRLTRQ